MSANDVPIYKCPFCQHETSHPVFSPDADLIPVPLCPSCAVPMDYLGDL